MITKILEQKELKTISVNNSPSKHDQNSMIEDNPCTNKI